MFGYAAEWEEDGKKDEVDKISGGACMRESMNLARDRVLPSVNAKICLHAAG